MTWSATGIASYRYGSCALWTLSGDLAGGGARRFAGRVELFFRAEDSRLLVDLRQVGIVDDIGADALARCRGMYPGFRVIGHPATWVDLVPAVRRRLLELDATPDLETGLGALAPDPAPAREDQRRHRRIPLQLPVELFFAGGRASAALRDVSRGGVRLSLVPEWCIATLRHQEHFGILGLAADPLGREFASDGPVPVALVRAFDAAALGARFTAPPPPV